MIVMAMQHWWWRVSMRSDSVCRLEVNLSAMCDGWCLQQRYHITPPHNRQPCRQRREAKAWRQKSSAASSAAHMSMLQLTSPGAALELVLLESTTRKLTTQAENP